MPDGRVLRVEDECVYIVRNGRRYRAPLSEVESAARVPSARVIFSLRRSDGVESAESVTLRRGTRTNRRHRRFGDLTGAAVPGTKLETTASHELGVNARTQPSAVAEAWVEGMRDGRFDAVRSLYLPAALVHTADRTVSGRRRVRAFLEDCEWAANPGRITMHSTDRRVAVTVADDADASMWFEIDTGAIAQHWIGTAPESTSEREIDTAPIIEVVDLAGLDDRRSARAERRLADLVSAAPEPIRHATLKLTLDTNPRVLEPAHAQVRVDLDGQTLRSRSDAETPELATDGALKRMRSKLARLRDRHRHSPEGVLPQLGEWHHGNRPTPHDTHVNLPRDERELIRHKSIAPGDMTIEEAAWDADQMDFHFFLFSELSTELDCVLERAGDELVLHTPDRQLFTEVVESLRTPGGMDLRVSAKIPPVHDVPEAVESLEAGGAEFLFFLNASSGNGNVVYRRNDGHYGLLSPT